MRIDFNARKKSIFNFNIPPTTAHLYCTEAPSADSQLLRLRQRQTLLPLASEQPRVQLLVTT